MPWILTASAVVALAFVRRLGEREHQTRERRQDRDRDRDVAPWLAADLAVSGDRDDDRRARRDEDDECGVHAPPPVMLVERQVPAHHAFIVRPRRPPRNYSSRGSETYTALTATACSSSFETPAKNCERYVSSVTA